MGAKPPYPHYWDMGMGRCREEMRAVGTLWIESRPGKQEMCEHVLSGKLIINVACKTERFYIPTNRVYLHD